MKRRDIFIGQHRFPTRQDVKLFLRRHGSPDVSADRFERAVARTPLPLEETVENPRLRELLRAYWDDQNAMPDGALVSLAMINRLVEYMLRANPKIKRALRLTYPFAVACLLIVINAEQQGCLKDDRPHHNVPLDRILVRIREEMFGPDGSNAEIDAISADLAAAMADLNQAREQIVAQMSAAISRRVRDELMPLKKISSEVSPTDPRFSVSPISSQSSAAKSASVRSVARVVMTPPM